MNHADRNGEGKNGQNSWTLAQDARLMEIYKGGLKIADYVHEFPGRSANAIRVRTSRITKDVFNGHRKDPRIDLQEQTNG